MLNISYGLNEIREKRQKVKNELFKISENIKSDNFEKISESDLYILFNLYDEIFLQSWFKENFKGIIKLKLSRQLTRAAGNTRTKRNIKEIKPEDIVIEVKISLNHLMNFNRVDRAKFVGGIEAESVLDSLMLILEHELCHVIEFLIYNKSSCKKKPFRDLVYSLFGQTETTHKLVSVNEINAKEYGFKPGDKVRFELKGKFFDGFILKINNRATVMSEDLMGNYIDNKGKRYRKYYVPLSCLIKIN